MVTSRMGTTMNAHHAARPLPSGCMHASWVNSHTMQTTNDMTVNRAMVYG